MVTRSRGRAVDWDVEQAIAGYFDGARQAGEKNIAAYIGQRLSRNPEYADRTPPARTLQRVVQRLLANVENWPEEIRMRNHTFAWDRLYEYGLPWEASSFLLSMWRFIQDLGSMLELEYDFSPLPSPTVRQAQWWWRVHQAVPEVENKLDIYLWAKSFVRYELYKDILGKPVDLTGLWAYLAYKPWESDVAHANYSLAYTRGRIPYLPIGWEFVPEFEELKAKLGAFEIVPGGMDNLRPERLPSEVFTETLAIFKPLVEINRTLDRSLKELEQSKQEATEGTAAYAKGQKVRGSSGRKRLQMAPGAGGS